MVDVNNDGSQLALVTGASSGIGEVIAEKLIMSGYRVICAARRLERTQALADRLGDRALGVTLDITDDNSVSSLLSRLDPQWRAIDVLVNNAGQDVGGRRAFHEGTAKEWHAIIDTNLMGTIRVTHALIETLRNQNQAHVVNIGSIAGLESYATGTLYAASKHGLHGFSESLRKDYAGQGLRVTEILPGMVRTGFAQARWNDSERASTFYDEYGTCLTPEDIANAVVYALQQPPHVTISQLVILPDN